MEERYFLCSIKPVAELFAIAVCRHWHIENNLHWALDVVFKEDRVRSKEKSMNRIRNKTGRNLESEVPVILAVLKIR